MSGRPRVVIDTNVLVSASLFPDSVPQRAVEQAITACSILVSESVLAEFFEVLSRPRFDKKYPRAARLALLNTLAGKAEFVVITSTVTDCRDPDDNKFLELALDGRATHLISGDADLLVLHPFRGIPILTPADFLAAVVPPPPDVV